MEKNAVSLARQVDFVFRQLEGELTNATAGTVLIQIRNNAVGKFGVRHHPIECKNGNIGNVDKGMSASQVAAFRQLAIDALQYRKEWTHGEILYDFSVRPNRDSWSASVLYESNYNMSTWNSRYMPNARAHYSIRDYH
ncbi:O-methyltransferase [Paenibacillus sp. HB172176]|uniref:O-methyltransferase n=1 Tax=Paenibacillus sp. HB172176 TaxID=2493690 RepID=UPI001439004A|nr:O-methyltransferase [Paenibacillus sp. HB172176]